MERLRLLGFGGVVTAALSTTLLGQTPRLPPSPSPDWPSYGRDRGGERFSPLTEINRSNSGIPVIRITRRLPPRAVHDAPTPTRRQRLAR